MQEGGALVAISHTHKFIFIKTFKTGGTSVEMFLEPLCMPPAHVVQHKTPTIVNEYGVIGQRFSSPPSALIQHLNRLKKWYNHMSAAKIRRRLGAENFGRYHKISAIRNPYDLLVSYFHQIQMMRGKTAAQDMAHTRAAFQTFVAGHWSNQLPSLTIKNQICVQRFIRMEHMATDLSALMVDLGVDPAPLPLPFVKKNNKRSRDLTVYYDKKSAEKVRDHMGWVFDRFDYATDIKGL